MDEELRLKLGADLKKFIGPKGARYFQLLYQFHRGIPLAVRLNAKRKGMGMHPIHFREGMQIRNFLRGLPECEGKDQEEEHWFDNNWIPILCAAIDREPKKAEQ